MRKFFPIFLFLILGAWFCSAVLYAEIGRIETKRERLRREAVEAGNVSSLLYERVEESFLKNDYAESDRMASDYLSRGLDVPHADEVLYLQALSLLKLGRFEDARLKLYSLGNAFPSSEQSAQAAVSVGDSYFYEGRLALARRSYEEALKKYPDASEASEALSRLGPKTMVPAAARQNASPGFAVQVGSFSLEKNAKGLVKKLAHKKYEAYLEEDPRAGLYRVRVGRFHSKEEALGLESRLKKEGYPTKICP